MRSFSQKSFLKMFLRGLYFVCFFLTLIPFFNNHKKQECAQKILENVVAWAYFHAHKFQSTWDHFSLHGIILKNIFAIVILIGIEKQKVF